MKKRIYLVLIVLALGCQDKDNFSFGIGPLLIGKWELLAYEQTLTDGTKEWKEVDSSVSEPALIVRSDGALLNGNGKAYCCISYEKYTINDMVYFVKPEESVPYNEECTLVYCGTCSDHQFEVKGEELIWTRCGSRSRYRRLP